MTNGSPNRSPMAATNTLIVYGLRGVDFCANGAATRLRRLAEERRAHYSEIKFLGRALLVFPDGACAAQGCIEDARECLTQEERNKGVRIGFSVRDIQVEGEAQPQHLELPSRGTLYFVSPPVSPPAEWEEGKLEEAPNKQTHCPIDFNAELFRALQDVAQQQSPTSGNVSPSTAVTILEADKDHPGLHLEPYE